MTSQCYARRGAPGERNAERRRMMTDRNAYIAYLEAEVERHDDVAVDVDACSTGLREVSSRVGRLADIQQEAQSRLDGLEGRFGGLQGRVGDAEERAVRLEGETARVEAELKAFESRLRRMDQAVNEARAAAEAEVARTRNELTLSAQELGERLESRMHELMQAAQVFADRGASSIVREAQVTCVRLADDALGAAEASQRKLEEFQKRTEASLEVLRVDVTSLRAQVAGVAVATPATSAPATQSPTMVATEGAEPAAAAAAVADELEARLAARLGQQILQLGDALRRVVRAQAAMGRQLIAPIGVTGSAHIAGNDSVGPDVASSSTSVTAESSAGLAGDRLRRAAIEDLYRELRALDNEDPSGFAKRQSPRRYGSWAPRRSRSSLAV